MSTHVWKTKVFPPRWHREIRRMFRLVRKENKDFNDSCRFVGYVLEGWRQSGEGRGTAESVLTGALRSGFRFTQGKWREEYLQAGRKALCQALRGGVPLPPLGEALLTSLETGEPCGFALQDWAQENDFPDLARVLRGVW